MDRINGNLCADGEASAITDSRLNMRDPISGRIIATTGLALLSLATAASGAQAQPEVQRHRIEARSSIEVRISTVVERDCNYLQINGQLRQHPEGNSGQKVWRLTSKYGQPGEMITTAMACGPNDPVRRERLMLNNGTPTTIPWRGLPIHIELPKSWRLEWRPLGSDQPFRRVGPL